MRELPVLECRPAFRSGAAAQYPPTALSDQFVIQVDEYRMEIPTIERVADVSVTIRVRPFQHVTGAELSLVAMADFNFEAVVQ